MSTEKRINSELAAENESLRSERDALAVENAALKSVVGECQAYFIAGIRNTIRPVNEGYLHMRCDTINDETPATDAALAAIRDAVLDRVIAKLGSMGSPDFTLMAVQALKNELREAK